MRPPIFIVCSNGDICAFRSPRAAESALESPDVESGEYTSGFDSIGTRLTIGVTEPTRTRRFLGMTTLRLTPVTIEPTGEPGAGAEQLRALLASELGDASADLASLVERAARTAAGDP
jgi:hypothetical protein